MITPDPTEAGPYRPSPASDPPASKRQLHAIQNYPASPEAVRAAAAMTPAAAPRGASEADAATATAADAATATAAAATTTTSRSLAAVATYPVQQYL